MKNMVVGIEGLVGSGKTSICRELLNYIPNSVILHGGNLYRGIIYALMNSSTDINLENLKNKVENIDIKDLMNLLKVEFKIENRETVIYVNNVKINEEILQSQNATMAVSIASGHANNLAFYNFANRLIEFYKSKFNVIVSGRDLMKIYPKLDYHFFIEADLEERVRRKLLQYNNSNYDEIKQNIIKRDELQKQNGYYTIYDNTIRVDVTKCKSVKESTLKVLKHIK